MKYLKKFLIVLLVVVAFYIFLKENPSVNLPDSGKPIGNSQSVTEAFRERLSNIQIRGSGIVSRILSDDNYGNRHQRFIVRISQSLTVFVAHNIDLAQRINNLKRGDEVEFYGEYEWNSKGGVIHWTHHDPNGRHKSGWLKHRGRVYR